VLPPTPDWLPEFCQPPTIFAAMVLAEIPVLVVALAPGPPAGAWTVLTLGTLLAQWIALASVAGLCVLRRALLALPPWLALLAACALLTAMSAAVAALAHAMAPVLLSPLARMPALSAFAGGLVLLALLMAALGVRYAYVYVQWRRQVQAQARAEVEALTARIRPHFLFNSMNTIAGLVHVDADLAERMIEDLSELFRAALAAGERLHPLAREFELCERYLAIEQLRLGDRLRVQWDVAAAPADIELPPLLLQPLVENAVYHGIQPRTDGGTVRISAIREGDLLVLAVGNPLPDRHAPGRGGHGMAQENVRRRLHYAYGPRARLDVREFDDYYEVHVALPLAQARKSRP
jgi:two-component system, LytTR family, sensor histidine kinase AlgZ